MLIIAFFEGEYYEVICDLFASRYFFAKTEVQQAIVKLQELQLLVELSDPSHLQVEKTLQNWSKYGWVDSEDYHVATLNYPFADYVADGRAIDLERMRQYSDAVPDIERTKTCKSILRSHPTPTVAAALENLDTSFKDMWTHSPTLKILDKDICLNVFSAVFGKLWARKLSDVPHIIADAISKTSPSGGARHPTEGYLFAISVQGLILGIYHFNVESNTLDLLKDFDASQSASISEDHTSYRFGCG